MKRLLLGVKRQMAGLEGCCTFHLSAGLRVKAQGAAALPASPWQILQPVEKACTERMLGISKSRLFYLSEACCARLFKDQESFQKMP